MNRSEVIKLIVKQLGIHETDSKEFMEILLAKISSKITKGDKLVVENIGSFELAQTESSSFGLAASEAENLDFTPAWNLGLGSSAVQFEVPSLVYDAHSEIDAFFSLSIEKPTIKLGEIIEDTNMLFTQTLDRRNFFEQKVNQLVAASNLIQGDYYKTEKLIDRNSLEETPGKLSLLNHSEFEEVRSSKIDELGLKLQWKKELDEESILDIDLTDEKLEVIETKIDFANGWDIGKLTPQPEQNFIDSSAEDFSRVNATTQELSVDLSELSSEISSDAGAETKQTEVEEAAEDSFFDFDSLLRESLVESVLSAEPVEEVVAEEKKEDDGAVKIDQKFIDYKERSEKLSMLPRFLDVRRWKKSEQYYDPFADDGTAGPGTVQKRNKFWHVLSFFLALIMFSFVYWKMYGIPSWIMETKTTVEKIIPKKITPKLIDRDYRLPLSYPYDKRSLTASTMIPKLAEQKIVIPAATDSSKGKNIQTPPAKQQLEDAAKNDKKETPKVEKKEPVKVEQKNQTPGNKKNENKSATPIVVKPAVKKDISKNVKDNIFMDNGKYVVQISSWKNRAKAEQEVARYLKKGFQTFLAEAEVPGRGIWYRVRVGYFNTLEEAETTASKIF